MLRSSSATACARSPRRRCGSRRVPLRSPALLLVCGRSVAACAFAAGVALGSSRRCGRKGCSYRRRRRCSRNDFALAARFASSLFSSTTRRIRNPSIRIRNKAVRYLSARGLYELLLSPSRGILVMTVHRVRVHDLLLKPSRDHSSSGLSFTYAWRRLPPLRDYSELWGGPCRPRFLATSRRRFRAPRVGIGTPSRRCRYAPCLGLLACRCLFQPPRRLQPDTLIESRTQRRSPRLFDWEDPQCLVSAQRDHGARVITDALTAFVLFCCAWSRCTVPSVTTASHVLRAGGPPRSGGRLDSIKIAIGALVLESASAAGSTRSSRDRRAEAAPRRAQLRRRGRPAHRPLRRGAAGPTR